MSVDPWRPTASLEVLRHRARLKSALRSFFVSRGYWEVDTPLLSRDTCIDPWIEPVAVPDPAQPGARRYLQTSPEFAQKRLLAAGAEAIFEITRAFRQGESGPRHNLEFTLVEWYRVGTTHHEQMTLVEDLVREIAASDVRPAAPPLPPGPFPRYTYDAAAHYAVGTTLLDKPTADLAELAQRLHVPIPQSLTPIDTDRDAWLNLLLAERIEPWLAQQPACFLYDYPASQAALARVRPGSTPVAERFELYLGGVELCNGYHELTDAEEFARRMAHNNAVRLATGAAPLPVDSQLLAAMRAGLPPCAGVALGFDRLVQWRLHQPDIRQVLAFPWDHA